MDRIKCASCGTEMFYDANSLDSIVDTDNTKLLIRVGCGQQIIIVTGDAECKK